MFIRNRQIHMLAYVEAKTIQLEIESLNFPFRQSRSYVDPLTKTEINRNKRTKLNLLLQQQKTTKSEHKINYETITKWTNHEIVSVT